MKDKKNIERLFQEKFKDFEAQPSPELWNSIKEKLHEKKKKRRVIPLWFRLSGVAAIFVIAFFAGRTLLITTSTVEESMENSAVEFQENSVVEEVEFQPKTNQDTEESSESSIENSSENGTFKSQNAIAETEKNNQKTSVNSTEKDNVRRKSSSISSEKILKNNSENAIVETGKSSKTDTKNGAEKVQENKFNPTKNVPNATENATVSNNRNTLKNTSEKPETKNQETQPETPNPLEELLREKENPQVAAAEEKINRWQITSTVAPVYFNSASGGSPINPEFSDNPKNFEKNLSYGVGVAYDLGKKWSVRGGVNKLTLGYNTGGIVYYPGLQARGADGNSSKQTIIVEDNNAVNMLSFEAVSDKTPGQINQTMGFIEVPMEVSYKILDRKFGIQVIGGMSTLFLNENNLSVVSNGMSTSLGQATNLNDVSFSSNIGLGFNYSFWKNFQANLEPRFKYQINTFSNDNGGFKPYFIGLYTGLSFKF